ncbi:Bromodomain-containing protein, partial [Atractiella rhizophila]
FRKPVDPAIPGCETYYDEIKHPMDLSTMQSKLDSHSYRTYGDIDKDFRQIVQNCKIFNPPGT